MPQIQIKNIDKGVFSFVKRNNGILHLANTGQYHIIFFKGDCECEINFKICNVKDTQVLFLNTSDVFIGIAKGNTFFQFSFDHDYFDMSHCETNRFINGLLFNNMLNCDLLTFQNRYFLKLESQFDKIISFQNESDFKRLNLTFKEFITQAIVEKHKQSFSEEKISESHQTVYKYLSLVNEHFKMEHNVFVYAQILRVQPKILTKIFSDLKIKNPKNYLNKRILLAAMKRLALSSNKSTEISYEVGFNEPAYFARFFKKNTGLTPKQFRIEQNLRKSTI